MYTTMTPHEAIQHMKEFTDTYVAFSDNIYQREAMCLAKQLEYTMLPPEDQDFLVGRKLELPIGFAPQSSHEGVTYFCSARHLKKLRETPELSIEDKQTITQLITFWKGKTTQEKIQAQYSKNILTYLSHGDFSQDEGTAFPLYRIGGAQMDPSKLLQKGLDSLIEEITQMSSINPPFYEAAVSVLKTFQKICFTYRKQLIQRAQELNDSQNKNRFLKMADNLLHIAHKKPDNFWQATQLSFLYYLVSGTYNYGRMDDYLGDFYVQDLNTGVLTEAEALDIIKGLWHVIIARRTDFDGRVVLGGKGRSNEANADRFALAAMEASRILKDVLPQLTLRCYSGMNSKVYDKALELIGAGTTFPILYNDDVNIPCVAEAFCVSEKEAEAYLPFGCGEYVLYNKSFGTPSGTINYLHELNLMIYGDCSNALVEHKDFDSFYNAYMIRLKNIIALLAQQEKLEYDICGQDAPFLYYSILFDDCLASGKPLLSGGIHHLGGTLESYGNINTSDSLTAIKKLVYEDKVLSPNTLAAALKNNFKGYEEVRQQLLNAPKYGNDDFYADAIAVRFHNDTCDLIRDSSKQAGLDSYLEVMINNRMHTVYGLHTGASADGRLGYTYMANANNPAGGMDKNGITALLNSLVKLSPKHHAGAAQNMRFSKEMFGSLLPKTKGLLTAYFNNGGAQAMITVLNRGDLEQAMIHPEKYQNLIVRVGGFSARFVELCKDDQIELLSRTLY